MASEDVLERALKHVDQCSCAGEHWRKPMGYKGRCLDCQMIEDLAAELRLLRAKLRQSEGLQIGALRLKRVRDLRLQAIRDTVAQNKDDDLVRREVEWFLDCDATELDGYVDIVSAMAQEGER